MSKDRDYVEWQFVCPYCGMEFKKIFVGAASIICPRCGNGIKRGSGV